MKKPVTQRKMFMAAGGMSETNSEGIISGFNDEELEDEYENRTPDNIEIIANNLRGDIRSMDERYLELAQMVGESAFETPEEVVALMQAQFAQPQAPQQPPPAAGSGQGIAGIMQPPPAEPQGIMQGVAEPGMEQPMPQPGMEQPMPQPGMEQPVQMAQGGIVHRQAGTPPSPLGGEMSLDQRLLQVQKRPGIFGRLGETLYNADEATRNFLSRQTQTAGPTTASGKPIPFVDKSGRFYQPVGGTNPNMPSRGPQFPSKFNMMTFGTRFAGPVAAVGLPLTQSLVESDPSRGQLYGSIFDLETGAGAEERPGFAANVPPVMRGKTGDVATDIGELPMRGKTGIPGVDIGGEEPAAPAVPIPTAVPAPAKVAEKAEVPAPKARGFKERVQDKIAIYKDVLGDDKNMRQAQALFLLAEAALNVAGAPGRSTAERLAKGLKGLPAGMGALGAEQAKQDLAIRSAAVSSVEQEMAAESKQATQLMLKMADLNAKNADINTMAQYLVDTASFTPEKAVQVAKLSKAGGIKPNEAGEMVDFTGRVISSPYRLTDGDVGFLPADGSMPFVSVGKRSLVPATAKDRPALATELGNNQSMVGAIERVMQLPGFESMFGPLAKVQSGLTSVITPFFGADAPFTNLPKEVQKNVAMELRNELIQLNARNTSRPSVWEQKQVEKFVGDPNAILTSPEEFFGVLNNFRVKAINRANEIEHQLTGSPLKQLETIPLGTSKDPLQAKDAAYLGEFFRLRPNASIFIQLPNEKSPRKYSAQEYFKQTGQQ
jgi:hypothetical protein